jgi:hypothetical protein
VQNVTTPVPTGILILRAWLEGDPPTELRARLTTTAGVSEAEHALIVAATVDDVCVAVRVWLSDFLASSGPR